MLLIMFGALAAQSDRIFDVLRILVGINFATHGAQKLFGWFGGLPDGIPAFITYGAGPIELIGGARADERAAGAVHRNQPPLKSPRSACSATPRDLLAKVVDRCEEATHTSHCQVRHKKSLLLRSRL